jgi:cytochrome c oxidase cbb3-type subunit 3
MDDKWIYGGRIDQIFASIYQGRPNGMPVWGGKIPQGQIWQIAAYVRSLSQPSADRSDAPGASGNIPAPPVDAPRG